MLKPNKRAGITITLTSSEDAKTATISFVSDTRMNGLDFLMALIDYANELAEQMYNKANESDRGKN